MPRKEFHLKQYQDDYVFSEAKFPAMVSAWGTGKTMCGITRAMIHSDKHPNNLGVIFRKEFTDLRDSTIKDFELYTGLQVNSSREVVLPNGSIIMFRHLEELRNLQNINLGWFLIEQAEELDTDDQFFMLFGRLRRAGVPHWGSVIANTRGHNWIWKLWKQNSLTDAHLIEATTFDNESNLPPDFFKTLEQVKINKPKRYACYVLNSWDETVGQFFGEFDRKIHSCKPFEISNEYKIYQCLDWGYAKPLACKWWAVAPNGTSAYCIREYYVTEKISPVAAAEIHALSKAMFGDYYIKDRKITCMYADPSIFAKRGDSSDKSIADDFMAVLQEKGDDGRVIRLPIYPSKNDRVQGWGIFRDMLAVQADGEPRAKWFDHCTHSIDTIPMMQYDDHKPEDMDSDLEDHACDADRYFFIERFGPKKAVEKPPYADIKDDGSQREWKNVNEKIFNKPKTSLSSALSGVGR